MKENRIESRKKEEKELFLFKFSSPSTFAHFLFEVILKSLELCFTNHLNLKYRRLKVEIGLNSKDIHFNNLLQCFSLFYKYLHKYFIRKIYIFVNLILSQHKANISQQIANISQEKLNHSQQITNLSPLITNLSQQRANIYISTQQKPNISQQEPKISQKRANLSKLRTSLSQQRANIS